MSKPVSCAARQGAPDSAFNGLSEVREGAALAAIHDSAGPRGPRDVRRCCADAMEHGAAVLAVRCKATVKEANDDLSIAKTLDRSKLGVCRPAGDCWIAQGGLQAVNEKGYEALTTFPSWSSWESGCRSPRVPTSTSRSPRRRTCSSRRGFSSRL